MRDAPKKRQRDARTVSVGGEAGGEERESRNQRARVALSRERGSRDRESVGSVVTSVAN